MITFDDIAVGDALPTLEQRILARHVVMGASSSRDWQPQHHDTHWAVERVKVKDIFLNTPNQAGWIERYLTDWTGPTGELRKLRFMMKRSICAGDTLRFDATVTAVQDDDIDLDVRLSVDGEIATECEARIRWT
jgi:acyl dehydratase